MKNILASRETGGRVVGVKDKLKRHGVDCLVRNF